MISLLIFLAKTRCLSNIVSNGHYSSIHSGKRFNGNFVFDENLVHSLRVFHRIRTKETENNLRIISADDTGLLRICEQCIRLGLPLIIENMGETIESSLVPLLNRDLFDRKISATGTIRFNEVDIEVNSNFRIYFITQLNNPHFLPDVCIRVTLSKLKTKFFAHLLSLYFS